MLLKYTNREQPMFVINHTITLTLSCLFKWQLTTIIAIISTTNNNIDEANINISLSLTCFV